MIIVSCVAVWAGTVQRERHFAKETEGIPAILAKRGIAITLAPGRYARIRTLAGDEFVADIVKVESHGYNYFREGVVDEDFKPLSKLKRLKSIDFSHTIITDAALAHVSHLPIEHVKLLGTRVTDDCTQHLVRFTKLSNLNLSCTMLLSLGALKRPLMGAFSQPLTPEAFFLPQVPTSCRCGICGKKNALALPKRVACPKRLRVVGHRRPLTTSIEKPSLAYLLTRRQTSC